MMAYLGRWTLAVLLSCCALPGLQAQQPEVNPDAKVLQDYQERIKKYLDIHKKADVPKMKETKDPADIKQAQDALAAAVRAARPNAKQGEIFTPEIAKKLRSLMYPEVKGPGTKETRQAIKEDQPAKVAMKVNARYPDDQPLPTVPPNILASLPKLPEQLEYRIVGTSLILRDVNANLIVDFIPGAIR
jgi:hypothetical protein